MAAAGCNTEARPDRAAARFPGRAPDRAAAPAQLSLAPIWEEQASTRRALVRGALATLGLRSDLARGLEALVLYLSACGADAEGCRARQAVMAEQLGIGRRTAQRQLRLLADAGFATVASSLRDRAGGRGANCVRIEWRAISAAARGAENLRSAAPLLIPESGAAPGQSGAAPGQSGAAPGQSGAALTNEYRVLVSGTSIPTTTTPTPPRARAGSAGRPGWDETDLAAVAEDLLAAGVAQAGQVVRELSAAGASPARVRAIIGWHADQRGEFGPGALVARLRADLPNLPLESGWPAPRPRAGDVGDTARERAGRARAERDAADRARSAGERAECARLESLHGAALDGLSLAERSALAETGLSPAERSFYGRELRRPVVRDPLVRRLLLGALGAMSQGTNAEEAMR